MGYTQAVGVSNEPFREQWVRRSLTTYRPAGTSPSLLDIGAGLSPFRAFAEQVGYSYRSHDFGGYSPASASPGLHTSSWDYAKHDFTCDILELPDEAAAEAVLCTEVLEHVPDPVRAFERIASLAKPGGVVIITVPFISLMHQSPFWFQSGLSPFWFEHWAPRNGLDVEELTVSGDYVDLMMQETTRLMAFKPRFKGLPSTSAKLVKSLRKRLSRELLESGGNGTLFVGRKES